jgi:protein O-mannosyl-transferase
MYAVVVALAIGASATSIGNGYALDDVALVATNARVHSLDAWWRLFTLPYWPPQFGASLYRPAITLGYALQWAAGRGDAWVFHLTSIVLYAASSALVLALFLSLLPPGAAFVGAAVFAVHPVHVEAVANVVGQSELVTAVATLAAAGIYIRRRQRGALGAMSMVWIALLFAVACLSKEHGLLLPGLLAALELFAVRPGADVRPVRERVGAVAPLFVLLGAVAIAYIVARTIVVGDALGEKHLVPVHGIGRLWVLLAVAPHWVRLLAWPAHLSADYSPHEIVIPDGPGAEIIIGLVIVTAALLSFVALGGREADDDHRSLRLGLVWLAITLLPVSNLFSVMLVAERTLFLPSIGAMMVAGALASLAMRRASARGRPAFGRIVVASVTTVVVVLGAVRSSRRQPVWRNDETLFAQTVLDAPLSYRAQFFYGQLLFAQGRRAEGEHRLTLAIALNPTPSDVSPLNYLATQYRDAGMCPQALPLYQRAIANDPARPDVRYGLAECLLALGRASDARTLAEEGLRRGDLEPLFRGLIVRSDSARSARH